MFGFKRLPILQFIMPSFVQKTLIRENKSLGLDKAARPDFSLKQFWAMSDVKTTHRQLDVLQKRNCHFSHAKLRALFKQRKEERTLNERVFYDKYNDLMVFESESLHLIVHILFAILDFNR